jgi:sucrose phosphorylase
MIKENLPGKRVLPNGVMFNAYPDSIGDKLSDIVSMLMKPEFKNVFSLFYILPTIFNSDLDRGFSIIDYDLNEELVTKDDLQALHDINIMFMFDLVINHLSLGSPQFLDLLKHGDDSKYKDFFIDWNEFWRSDGSIGPDGYVIPRRECLDKLFMRKPGLPILKVRFPDGTDRPYWNTFYQEVKYKALSASEIQQAFTFEKLTDKQAKYIAARVDETLASKQDINEIELGDFSYLKADIIAMLEQTRQYLGQMDLNAQSQQVWDYYDETLKKLRDHGGQLVRLDAFAYLHKSPGEANFFNKPGTWLYLEKLKNIADKYGLILVPEIHSEYGNGLHEEIADKGFSVYDFFLPGLVIHALDHKTNRYLLRWMNELIEKKIETINMLGCHDGIPVLDLKGKHSDGISIAGLLNDSEIDEVIELILDRGGRVKNLYGPDGKKISYYQVNATFFSALGEDEKKFRLARAIQMFMPGLPQVWYLDLFAGKNDYAAADKGGIADHKEINRTTLCMGDIEQGLKREIVQDQLEIIRLRNTSPAFKGTLTISNTDEYHLLLNWSNEGCTATLNADLRDCCFSIVHTDNTSEENVMSFH